MNVLSISQTLLIKKIIIKLNLSPLPSISTRFVSFHCRLPYDRWRCVRHTLHERPFSRSHGIVKKLIFTILNRHYSMPKSKDPCKATACLIQKCLKGNWILTKIKKCISCGKIFIQSSIPIHPIHKNDRKQIPRSGVCCCAWANARLLPSIQRSFALLFGY